MVKTSLGVKHKFGDVMVSKGRKVQSQEHYGELIPDGKPLSG